MQNIKIDIYISDLLYKYDCVVIPDFGGFVANHASAKIQPIQHRLNPPSKQISFNKNLKSNDGLLSNHIAERKALNYQEANELIKSFVNQSIEGLNKGDKILIEKVGTLFLDPERNIQFIAEEKNDFLLDSFGLGTLRSQPIAREGSEERIKKEIKKVIPLIKEEKKKKRLFWPIAGVFIFLLVGTYFLNSQYTWVDTTQVQYSNIFSSPSSEIAIYKETNHQTFEEFEIEEKELVLEEGVYPYVTGDEEVTNLFVDNRKEKPIVAIDNTRVVEEETTIALKFHVMGGCFSNKRNAQKLVKQLKAKGYDARLLGEFKNLHAVSFGSFASDAEARNLLTTVKETENSAAWLLVKPF